MSEGEDEELPPGTGIIDSIKAERHSLFSFAAEVIDNSFDAEATKVELIMAIDKLQVTDNGIGITRARAQALVKLAQHESLPGTRLGKFGIGLKNKAIAFGDGLRIVTVSVDGRLIRTVDWEVIRTSGTWRYPPAVHSKSDGPTGTEITISQLRRKPAEREISKTSEEIQRHYYPALKTGRTIFLNGIEIDPIVDPELEFVEEGIAEFSDGRIAVISGGKLVNHKLSKLRQVDVVFDYRVIKKETLFGCKDYGGTRSMYARVELFGPWRLTKFKDDLADDPCEDELERFTETILEPILKRCSSDAMYLKNKTLEQLLNDMLPSSMRMVRPEQRRKLYRSGEKTGRQGTVKLPSGKPGPAKGQKQSHGLKIEFADNLSEQCGYGRAIVGKAVSVIQLAADNPTIRTLMNQRDQETAKLSLYGYASFIFEGHLRDTNQQLRFLDEPLGLAAWKMAEQDGGDTQDIVEALTG